MPLIMREEAWETMEEGGKGGFEENREERIETRRKIGVGRIGEDWGGVGCWAEEEK